MEVFKMFLLQEGLLRGKNERHVTPVLYFNVIKKNYTNILCGEETDFS